MRRVQPSGRAAWRALVPLLLAAMTVADAQPPRTRRVSGAGAAGSARNGAAPPAAARALPQVAPPVASADSRPAIVSQGNVDARRDVNFAALALPSRVYVGQQVTYQIGVFLSEEVAQRLRRNPEFVPPDVRSMLAYDLPSPSRPLSREEDGRRYDVHVFQRALFPLTAGTHVLAPARLTYSLPLSNSFFSREETHSARTGALTIVAQEPPLATRPADYTGAVGRLSVSARVDTPSARVGDPVTLVVRVQGTGNVSLFPRPSLALPWGDAVNGAERVAIDSGLSLVQGRKDFEWVVTPRREGTLTVPSVRYPYWNPYSEQYEVALTQPLDLRVGGGALAARVAEAVDSTPRLPLRERYRGAIAPPLATSPVLWALLGVVPLPALALALRQRPRRPRLTSVDLPLRQLAAGATAAPSAVRRAFADAVARRTGVGAAAMTDARGLVRALRLVGVSTETAQRAQWVLAEIDRATYGGSSDEDGAALARRAADTFAAIDLEAVPRVGGVTDGGAGHARRGRGAARPAMLLLAFVGLELGAIELLRADAVMEAARFARGAERYAAGDFAGAMLEYRDIVERQPRAADAWANLGTAAWYAEDSATAAIGWQRALRLEPLAGDVRGRLEATPGFRAGLLGDVPPIPVDGAAAIGALLWIGGWGALAWATWRRRPDRRAAAFGALGLGATVGVLTLAVAEVQGGRGRVVVVEPDRLRSAPALGAEAGAETMRAESARELAAQGVWSRVRFPDGRTGWMETRRLASLDLRRAP
jgi:hypothetical protein